VKVKMNVNTNYQGFHKKGSKVNVSDEIGKRWEANGIAELVEEVVKEDKTPEVNEDAAAEMEGQVKIDDVLAKAELKDLTAKELYDKCVEAGIEVEQKQAKKHYIDLLTE